MDMQNGNVSGESLRISTDALARIARCAAMEIEGVAEVSCGGQKKVRDLLEKVSFQSPVQVEVKDGTVEITINLIVAFGTRVPALAEKVQRNVKDAVQNMTGITVSRVNLVIAGVAQPAPAAQPAAPAAPAAEE